MHVWQAQYLSYVFIHVYINIRVCVYVYILMISRFGNILRDFAKTFVRFCEISRDFASYFARFRELFREISRAILRNHARFRRSEFRVFTFYRNPKEIPENSETITLTGVYLF